MAIESSLTGTSGEQLISHIYHGTSVSKVICQKCGRVSGREVGVIFSVYTVLYVVCALCVLYVLWAVCTVCTEYNVCTVYIIPIDVHEVRMYAV